MPKSVANIEVQQLELKLLLAPEASHHTMKMIVWKTEDANCPLVHAIFLPGSFVIYTHLACLKRCMNMTTSELHFVLINNVYLNLMFNLKNLLPIPWQQTISPRTIM